MRYSGQWSSRICMPRWTVTLMIRVAITVPIWRSTYQTMPLRLARSRPHSRPLAVAVTRLPQVSAGMGRFASADGLERCGRGSYTVRAVLSATATLSLAAHGPKLRVSGAGARKMHQTCGLGMAHITAMAHRLVLSCAYIVISIRGKKYGAFGGFRVW